MIKKIYVIQSTIESSADYGYYTIENVAGFLNKKDATYTSKCFNEIAEIYKPNLPAFQHLKAKQYAIWSKSIHTETYNIEQHTARVQAEEEAATLFWNNVRSRFPQHLKDISHLYPCKENLEPWFDVVKMPIWNFQKKMNSECIIDDEGAKHWMVGGKHHREDGPALEFVDGTKYWYINDQELPCKDQESFLKYIATNYIFI